MVMQRLQSETTNGRVTMHLDNGVLIGKWVFMSIGGCSIS